MSINQFFDILKTKLIAMGYENIYTDIFPRITINHYNELHILVTPLNNDFEQQANNAVTDIIYDDFNNIFFNENCTIYMKIDSRYNGIEIKLIH